MILSRKNEADLRWYFNNPVYRCDGSAFGVQLERQDARYRDSSGQKLPAVGNSWHYIHCKEIMQKKPPEPSYTPNYVAVIKAATISRKLSKLPSIYQQALEIYHGGVGEKWETQFGRSRRSCGLIPLTDAGRQWLKPLYRRYKSLAVDSIIQCELRLQDSEPNDIREKQIEKVDFAAIELHVRADRAYQALS